MTDGRGLPVPCVILLITLGFPTFTGLPPLLRFQHPWSSSNRGSPAYNKGQIKEATDILKVFRQDASPPASGPSRHQGLTAANLIDAIIVHQINQVDENSTAATKETPQQPELAGGLLDFVSTCC
jgi:hypothetical protein